MAYDPRSAPMPGMFDPFVAQRKQALEEQRRREEMQRSQRGMVPHFNSQYQNYGNLAGQYGGREAPQAGYSDFRGQQVGLGRMLAAEAQGKGIGQQLIRQQAQGMADRGMQQQLGMAASARPGQSALATRGAMMNSANMNAQVGGQSAMAAGQHQLGAMGQYGQFLQGARGADESMNQFNVDARLKQLGLNDASQLEALRQRLQLSGMQQQGGQFGLSLEEQRRQFDESQPSTFDKFLGAAGGGLTLATGMGWRPFAGKQQK